APHELLPAERLERVRGLQREHHAREERRDAGDRHGLHAELVHLVQQLARVEGPREEGDERLAQHLRESADVFEDLAALAAEAVDELQPSQVAIEDRRRRGLWLSHEDGAFYAAVLGRVNVDCVETCGRALLRFRPVRLLRSLVAWTVIVLATIVFAILAIPLSRLPRGGRWFQRCSKGWSGLILGASGVRIRVLHADRTRRAGLYVIASTHESFYDIPVLFASLPMPVRFLAKRNLFRLPFLGWAMSAAGFVPVDRADHSHGKEMLDTALSRL